MNLLTHQIKILKIKLKVNQKIDDRLYRQQKPMEVFMMAKVLKALDTIVAEVLFVSKPFIVVLVVVIICKVITFVATL